MSTIRSTGIKPSRRKANPSRRREPVAPSNLTPLESHEDSEREAWVRNAERLAKFSCEHLANRDDAYGRYVALDARRGKNKARTIREGATEEVVSQHFRAIDRGDIIGFHTTSKQNTCRWLVLDVDQHGDSNPEAELRNQKAVFDFASMLSDFGAKPLVMKSDGRGGFHIWVIFDKPVPSAYIYALGKAVVQHWKELGIDEPEVFPKQPHLEGGKLGNWVRLPGLHHTYDFYTQVWDGEKWLNGQGAIDHILNVKPCPSELVSGSDFEIEIVDDEVPSKQSPVEDEDLDPVQRVLNRLSGARRSGGGWTAKCPAHNDSDPSLSVSEGRDGCALVHCHAGCEYEKILHAIELEPSDLFPKSSRLTDRELRMRYPRSDGGTHAHPTMQLLHQAALRRTSSLKVDELATSLGVTAVSLNELEVAWDEEDKCWLFPERDGRRRIIGLMKRYPDGSKYFISGGARGLYIPKSFVVSGEDIFVAEGGSDTAAGCSRGWNIIGRPSAHGGSQHLVDLLKDAKGRIYVIADNDVKRDGSWPGRRGAELVAQRLTASIKAAVLITNPPMRFKDLRAIVQSGEMPR